ncbi:MAG: hypothetical protein A2Z99_15965 [Treponema sp. GWB1_62_6]|nr:MAG: hypothetical protein A2001_20165 [Treponema sp. GWC1_61_84]OHE71014.1 MAG: hypothetical protein A2Z99_15965 [Treponema sp. GWB1_62_6]OHE71782.1 MAG: hypothetical protein A2413_19195 [Treponema sp. RIFOXYC1_FULL_61_9]HCM25645.1 hypothetical protein [Treponema sp.]
MDFLHSGRIISFPPAGLYAPSDPGVRCPPMPQIRAALALILTLFLVFPPTAFCEDADTEDAFVAGAETRTAVLELPAFRKHRRAALVLAGTTVAVSFAWATWSIATLVSVLIEKPASSGVGEGLLSFSASVALLSVSSSVFEGLRAISPE